MLARNASSPAVNARPSIKAISIEERVLSPIKLAILAISLSILITYRSISHYKLIQDLKKIYQDQKVQNMLEDVIRNPINTPRGYKNPDTGIALRGPLSQLFSAIYLKPLDEAFDSMDVLYARYQDDLLIS